MRKTFRALYRVICDTSIIFTLIIAVFAIAMNPVDNTAQTTADSILSKDVIFTFLKFSLCVGLSSLFFLIKKLPNFITQVLHFIAVAAAFVVFILLASDSVTSSRAFVVMFVFVLIYWLIFGLVKLLKIPFKKRNEI